MDEKSYIILHSDKSWDGPFDINEEAQELFDLISTVQRTGWIMVIDVPKIHELEVITSSS